MKVDKLVAWRLALAALREEATGEIGEKPLPGSRSASAPMVTKSTAFKAVGLHQTSAASNGKQLG